MLDAARARTISANDMHVIWTQFICSANAIHVAMCLFDDDHRAQAHLNTAMQACLIGAEQCRQLHASLKKHITPEEKDPS
jgi:hypothetical protein